MRYLIGIDLDGTLLDKESKLTSKTINFLQKAEKEGHIVVLSTGRSFDASIDYYNEIDLNSPLINDSGGYISYPKDQSKKPTLFNISDKDIKTIKEHLSPYFFASYFSTSKNIYAFGNYSKCNTYFFAQEEYKHFLTNKSFGELPITSILAFIEKDKNNEFLNYFNELTEINVYLRSWGLIGNEVFVYEILKKGVNKLSALKSLLKEFSLSEDSLITFGDGANDLEMVKEAKYGYAMKDSRLSKLDGIKYITEYDNANDGVILALSSILNIKS
ncbi:MAG: Cof-type HAD-IIB family hydrolase [Acholeplasmatales bacterium]|nr:Cof-type HAD-IIB family hydrolase [Acholeplasmatales bacterium]